MMTLLFIVLFLAFLGLFFFVTRKVIIEGREDYLLYYFVLFLCSYNTLLILSYQQTGSPMLVNIIKYTKDALVIVSVVVFFFYRRDIFSTSFKLHRVDFIFLAFLGLATIYAILPIGPASLFNKLVYLKHIYFLGFAYFLGRNSKLRFEQLHPILNLILGISIAAFCTSFLENIFNVHLQTLIDFPKYNFDINETDPKGNYGLTWTFETSAGYKRFAAFFTNPLEMSSAMLLAISTGFILFLATPHRTNQIYYLLTILLSIGCLYFAISRSSFAAFFLLLFIASISLRYYSILVIGFLYFLGLATYIIFFASKELQEFVWDTITFQQASSLGHVIEWLEAIESISTSPQGIGLAMSGNVGGVDDEMKVGGENQYLVFGVQLGVVGMLLYIMLLYNSIKFSLKTFRLAPDIREKVIPFIAGTSKFAFLLPLFTANAENYTYFSLVTWWMVGYSIQSYNRLKHTPLPEDISKNA